MGLIRVSATELKAKAEELTSLNNNLKTNVSELETSEQNLASMWDGEAKELETGISEKQDDPFMELTDEIKDETYNKFKCSIKCVLENKNSCSSKHAC